MRWRAEARKPGRSPNVLWPLRVPSAGQGKRLQPLELPSVLPGAVVAPVLTLLHGQLHGSDLLDPRAQGGGRG